HLLEPRRLLQHRGQANAMHRLALGLAAILLERLGQPRQSAKEIALLDKANTLSHVEPDETILALGGFLLGVGAGGVGLAAGFFLALVRQLLAVMGLFFALVGLLLALVRRFCDALGPAFVFACAVGVVRLVLRVHEANGCADDAADKGEQNERRG